MNTRTELPKQTTARAFAPAMMLTSGAAALLVSVFLLATGAAFAGAPRVTQLDVSPAPFPVGGGEEATITLHLSETADVLVTVRGNRTVYRKRLTAQRGDVALRWNGHDTLGKTVPPGFYGVRVSARNSDGRDLARFGLDIVEDDRSAPLDDQSVLTKHLATGAVTGEKLASSSVFSFHITDNAIQARHLSPGAVGELALTDGQVKTRHLADDAVTAAKVAADAIGSSELTSDSVGASEIAAGAVGNSELANDAVTAGKVALDTLTAADLALDSVGASEIAANAVASDEVALDTLTAADLAPDAVGASEIGTGAVDFDEIAADAVRSAEIQDGQVGSAEIAAGAVTRTDLAPGGTLTGTISIDPPLIAADTCTIVTPALVGVAINDQAIVAPPDNLNSGLVGTAATQDTVDVLSVRICNTTAAGIDAAAGSWPYTVIR